MLVVTFLARGAPPAWLDVSALLTTPLLSLSREVLILAEIVTAGDKRALFATRRGGVKHSHSPAYHIIVGIRANILFLKEVIIINNINTSTNPIC